LSIGILSLSSCNVLKFVPEGKSLLDGNRVKVEGTEKIEDLKEQILLVPNRKMLLLVKFNLWTYYIGDKVFRKDSTWAKRFFTETIGEKPVYLDTVKVNRSEANMKRYLFLKGYFDAKVNSKVTTVLKRSYVVYTVNPGKPYEIRTVNYNASDRILDMEANKFAKNTLLKSGDHVDQDKIDEESNRLTMAFRNNGFYYFNKQFISVLIDSGGHNRGADIYYNLDNPGEVRDARPQIIQKVTVDMDFKQQFGRKGVMVKFKGIEYLFNGYNIKPNIINRSIKIRPGELYSQENYEATYNKLLGLGLFNLVNIKIQPYRGDTTNKLEVIIVLRPLAKHVYIIEPQLITTDKPDLNSGNSNPRNYGFAGTASLNNKNVFRNAEDFNIRFRLAAETQFGGGSVPVQILPNTKTFNVFSNYESNLTFELLYPKLVGLIRLDTTPHYRLQLNHTSINLTYLTEINTNYTRKSVPLNLTYQTLFETKDRQTFFFYWSPVQFSYNNAVIRPEFLEKINNPTDSLRLVRTFRSYIVPSHKLAVVYSNKDKSHFKYWNIRYTAFEIAGNVTELGYRLLTNDDSKEKQIFGVPYFQFFRTDIDAVHYNILGKSKTFVLRANLGIGKAYGNSYILPFERQFYVGGSNSLRAWRPRLIGPGGTQSSSASIIDKTGDMMLVTNAEYRFTIAPGFMDGAFFLDAGNIWQLSKSANDVAKFTNKFYKQLAFNTGVGMRLDLSFFIIRLDWGIPLHDPSELETKRWVIKNLTKNHNIIDRTVLSLAVGYPF
jgi:outer membrane protein assembly factor BamA